MSDDVAVIQADRDAAAALVPLCFGASELWQSNVRAGYYDDGEIVQAFAKHRLSTPSPDSGERMREADALAWLSLDRRLSLAFHGPVYGDDDDQTEEWRVTREEGSINDREWIVVGKGDDPLSAILSARAALQESAR